MMPVSIKLRAQARLAEALTTQWTAYAEQNNCTMTDQVVTTTLRSNYRVGKKSNDLVGLAHAAQRELGRGHRDKASRLLCDVINGSPSLQEISLISLVYADISKT